MNMVTLSSKAEELLASAQKLKPAFASRLDIAERNRQVPAENIEELRRAGLFRVFQPKRYGGAEISMAEVLPIIAVLAVGCPSTAWALAVLQIHQWIIGLFPVEAQDEVFADNPDTRLVGVLQPVGGVTREGDGYRIPGGRWPYASGCDYADWVHLGGLVTNENGPPEPRFFVVPRQDFEIFDDWEVTGLRGTGSKSITVENIFVPAHHSIPLADAVSGKAGLGESAVHRSAFLPMLSLNITAPALGATRRAIEVFKAHIAERNMPFSPAKQVAAPQTHRQLAQAITKTNTAELLLANSAASVRDFAERGAIMAVDKRLRTRVESSYAVKLCLQAVNELCEVSGGQMLQETHPLQRLQRDVQAMSLHAALNHDTNLELLGADTLGQPLSTQMV